jgi:hypothetical protein
VEVGLYANYSAVYSFDNTRRKKVRIKSDHSSDTGYSPTSSTQSKSNKSIVIKRRKRNSIHEVVDTAGRNFSTVVGSEQDSSVPKRKKKRNPTVITAQVITESSHELPSSDGQVARAQQARRKRNPVIDAGTQTILDSSSLDFTRKNNRNRVPLTNLDLAHSPQAPEEVDSLPDNSHTIISEPKRKRIRVSSQNDLNPNTTADKNNSRDNQRLRNIHPSLVVEDKPPPNASFQVKRKRGQILTKV